MPRTHKTLPRLYVETAMSTGTEIALDKAQTNYLVNVLRRGAGEQCVVFNGRDGAFLARIAQASKKTVTLDLVAQTAAQTEPNDLWCGFAPIKRLDYIVQKATEMGAGTIQPVITRHVQNPRVNIDKLRANAIEAAEQCEVLSVPQIEDAIAFDALITGWTEAHGDRKLIFCDEDAASESPIDSLAALEGTRLGLLVGPEGGFAPEERERLLAQDFVIPISLGPRILRADTAAVAALALIQAVAGDWQPFIGN
ncbi:16S rRNA (uracil(1498)-N(3))-methyltransferase [Pelagibacterium xiamenense]|uniref:16S rRNA (uracil(1498)-N(3))-methyltransferase n=1 Tax=Pelagibacterium xiamenense TaxID=2901140 RepID=UPI001E57C3D6|nr:16S rRNA (uracil(1498)-N(3))-methyltransferase [Pelagibacterium xiamenense]MCD7059231.1 16S rRNA (uracil(1498)-N(3))-methyltransferase [Pelagibacterium xiamenense]